MGENNPKLWVRTLAFVLRSAVRLIVRQELAAQKIPCLYCYDYPIIAINPDVQRFARLVAQIKAEKPTPPPQDAALNASAETLTAEECEKLRAAACPQNQLSDAIDADVLRFARAVALYKAGPAATTGGNDGDLG